MTWREFWNADTPIYVNDRHKALHYRLVAQDVAALLRSPSDTVLDHGCGEALSAADVAARCGRLYLLDGAPLVRERLALRFARDPKIAVLSPEELGSVPDGSLDLVVVNSLLQYLSPEEFHDLLGLWRTKLREGGRLVLADVIPHEVSPIEDARALLGFAWRGGFLRAALLGLVRTALSDYRTLRNELGLTGYDEAEMLDTLRARGYAAARRPRNIGHNPARMTFEAVPE